MAVSHFDATHISGQIEHHVYGRNLSDPIRRVSGTQRAAFQQLWLDGVQSPEQSVINDRLV